MKDLLNLLNSLGQIKEFDRICIGLASPEKIRSWSYGEVKTPETINYRTFKPEHQGLFCAKIFGPVKDYECLCGKYKLFTHQGVVCEKCGVEVTKAQTRRERMAHIELATPVAHIWYLKSLPSRIGLLLDMSRRDLERVLYYEAYVVLNPGLTSLKPKQLLSESAYLDALEEYGHEFEARMGGEAIYELLCNLDLVSEEKQLREQLHTMTSENQLKRLRKRLKLIQTFRYSHNQPEWMVLKVLPVLPPDLRPLVHIEGGRFAASDLNELYRQVINRNNRTKRLIELKAPEVIIRNERRMLQESVDALLDNGRQGRTLMGANKQPLQSLSDLIKGKQGRFRQHLLGKRVDYSGRSVIVVEPTLKLHQCGLPKEMALELFKPFLFHHLQKRQIAPTLKVAKQMVDERIPEIWDFLQEVIREHPVLLNRAPTLYRLGIQAFEPVLVEGKALQISPLICKAFNANFDGDQMAVHIPLSIEAQLESRVLMMSSNNVLSPANGEPLIVPSREMVLGLYLMTQQRKGCRGEGMVFVDIKEVHRAYESGVVDLQASIEVRLPSVRDSKMKKSTVFPSQFLTQQSIYKIKNDSRREKNQEKKRVKTTVGRALLLQFLPNGLPFELINLNLNQKYISKLIRICYHRLGLKNTIIFTEKLMEIGFTYATRAGITLNIDDFVIPKFKKFLLRDAYAEVEEIQKQYLDGQITYGQRYNRIIDIWTRTTKKMANLVTEQLSEGQPQNTPWSESFFQESENNLQYSLGFKIKNNKNQNVLYMMMNAGIQSLVQICQLTGMRGLMTKPNGSILEFPITANFREGLDVQQYFISTHGTRKGLADTALKTANAGYLTRRLIDVAQDVIIVEADCGTTQGLVIAALIKNGQLIETFKDRVYGRVVAQEVFIPGHKKPFIKAGTLLGDEWIERLESAGIDHIVVRSPITCQSNHGICAQCYGQDLARGQLVNHGEAIGIIAAQSIGESGTQLTMRTHHAGGMAKRMPSVNYIEVKTKGIVKFYNLKLIRRAVNNKELKITHEKALFDSQPSGSFSAIVVSRSGELSIEDDNGLECQRYAVPYGALVTINEGDYVEAGQQIAHWDAHTSPIITEFAGRIRFDELIEGMTVNREMDDITGLTTLVVKEPKQRPSSAKDLRPRLQLVNEHHDPPNGTQKKLPVIYFLPPRAIINVEEGAKVNIGDVVARIPQDLPKSRDITQGLLRVADLFEARVPKEPAILAFYPGTISFGKDTKTKQKIVITGSDGQQEEFLVPKWRSVNVFFGQHVRQGDVIVEGELNPHDILRLKGVNELAKYLIDEMQEIYRLQGVKINNKHFEVIIRQMLRTVIISEPGNTSFLFGDVVSRTRLLEENQKVAVQSSGSKQPATYEANLLGITKASLATESFISAASFIDTTRVLLAGAINGKCDELLGLKENVIIGHLIPAGTGLVYHNRQRKG